MVVRTIMLDDELYESVSESGLTHTIDMRNDNLRQSQNPPELLLSALTACSAVDVVSILKKRRKTIQSFDMITTGRRKADYPRAFTDIHCEYVIHSNDVTEEEAMNAAKLAIEKYCTVAASLKSSITWSVRILPVGPLPPPTESHP